MLVAAAIEEAAKEMPDARPDARRAWIVSQLNQKIDLPVLTEEHEEAVLSLLVDAVADVMAKNINQGHKAKLISNAKTIFHKLRNS
jgi:hypothetical protein